MLRLTTMEFFFRLIPEMMIFVWGIYVISREEFKLKNYLFSSLSLAVLAFAVRKLPIHYGVHTIVNNVITICILIIVGIPIIKSIYSTLVMTLLLLGNEAVNIMLLYIFHINMNSQVDNLIMKLVLGIPSLIFLAMLINLIDIYFSKKEEKGIVSNGKISY